MISTLKFGCSTIDGHSSVSCHSDRRAVDQLLVSYSTGFTSSFSFTFTLHFRSIEIHKSVSLLGLACTCPLLSWNWIKRQRAGGGDQLTVLYLCSVLLELHSSYWWVLSNQRLKEIPSATSHNRSLKLDAFIALIKKKMISFISIEFN